VRRLRPALVLALAAALTAAAPAGAGVLLERSAPAASSTVPRPPSEVRLDFDGPVQPAPGTGVYAAGKSVVAGSPHVAPGRPDVLVIPLRNGLNSGPYAVRWSAVGRADGQVASGAFIFAVGSGLPASAAPSPAGGSGGTPWLLIGGSVLAGAGVLALAALLVRRRRHALPLGAAAAAAAAGGALVAVALLRGGTTAAPTAGQAVVYAGQDDRLAIGLELSPKGDAHAALRATVLGFDGPVSGLGLRFSVDGEQAASTPCGKGCYSATVPLSGRPRAIAVRVRDRTLHFSGPATWPAPSGLEIIRQAERTIDELKTLVVHSRLASDQRHEVQTVYHMVAPDRLAYRNGDGSASIVIGNRRWDRRPGGRWIASTQVPALRQPAPFWPSNVTNASVVRTARVGGRDVWVVSFLDPSTPSWFTAWIDRKTYRTVRLDMVAVAHFMHDRDGPFNAPVAIEPPGA
jgi:methionine-rich copper-binding protein CopC